MKTQATTPTPLRDLIREYGFNRTWKEAGTTRSHLWRILNHERNPVHETRQRIADALGVSPENVLWPAEEREQGRTRR